MRRQRRRGRGQLGGVQDLRAVPRNEEEDEPEDSVPEDDSLDEDDA